MNLNPQVTEYTISPFPLGHEARRHYAIRVQLGAAGWRLINDGFWWTGHDWHPDHRHAAVYDEHNAVAEAQQLMPVLDVNGVTTVQRLERG